MIGEPKGGVLRTQDHFRGRAAMVKEAQEMLSLNEKIKAAIMLNKLEKFGELSTYIKRRVLGNKVKRTIQMRSKYSGNHSNSSLKRRSLNLQNQISLTIDTTDNRSTPPKTKKSISKLFAKLSPKGQRYDLQPEGSLNRLNKRYSSFEKKQYEDSSLNLGSSITNNDSQTSPAKKITIESKKKYEKKSEQVPFILQNRTKKQMRKFLTISKDYSEKIAEIDQTSRFEEQLRKQKQKSFYSRIRNPKLYYQMIEKVRYPINLQTIHVEAPDHFVPPSLMQLL